MKARGSDLVRPAGLPAGRIAGLIKRRSAALVPLRRSASAPSSRRRQGLKSDAHDVWGKAAGRSFASGAIRVAAALAASLEHGVALNAGMPQCQWYFPPLPGADGVVPLRARVPADLLSRGEAA